MNRRVALVVALVAIPLLVLAAVKSRQGAPEDPRPLVVATVYPLAEFARLVGGERIQVRTLVPSGAGAHDYEPGPRDVAAIGRARLFIYVGAGMEPWVGRMLETLPGSVGVVRATAGLPLVLASTTPGGRAGVQHDPHAWVDPLLAAQMVETIGIALAATDPAGAEHYRASAAREAARLADLHARFETGLAACEHRLMVTTHTAFAYLARRYALDQVGLSGLAPEAEPPPGEMARLAAMLSQRGVRVIFVERIASPGPAGALAREVGARIVELDPLEGLSPQRIAAGEGYFSVMERNLEALREGLGCR